MIHVIGEGTTFDGLARALSKGSGKMLGIMICAISNAVILRSLRDPEGATMSLDLSISVLVVDDYKTMIRIIKNLLKQIGFSDVDDASDGTEALAKLKEKNYGLVISDWNMEPMTGYELLQKVRADEALKDIPFIMVTAEAKSENVVAAKEAGVNNYIVKPFNAQTLKGKIESVFQPA